MSTENTAGTSSTDETSGQEEQGQQQAGTTPETGANGEPQQTGTTPSEPAKLPDDHPLVKTLAANKQKLSSQNTEIAELRAKSAQVTKLEQELNDRPTKEAVETLQTRYDRLEAFLQAAGGPLAQALDSRTFTKDLFESDKDVEDLAKEWHRTHPTATSAALGGGAGEGGGGKVDPNKLIRAAFGGGK